MGVCGSVHLLHNVAIVVLRYLASPTVPTQNSLPDASDLSEKKGRFVFVHSLLVLATSKEMVSFGRHTEKYGAPLY